MKKDIPLIMERTIYTYVFLLVVCFILKLVGLDYVGIDMSSPFIVSLDKVMNNFIIFNIVSFVFIMFYQYIMTSLILNHKTVKLTLYTLIPTFIFQFFIKNILMTYNLNVVGETLYLFILCLVYNKINKTTDSLCKRFIIVILLNILLQFISAITRYNYSNEYVLSPSINVILTIDYSLAMLLMYKIYFMKGDVTLCGVFQGLVGSFSQKLTSSISSLRKYLTKFQRKIRKLNSKLHYLLC